MGLTYISQLDDFFANNPIVGGPCSTSYNFTRNDPTNVRRSPIFWGLASEVGLTRPYKALAYF
jgi:hypothetical protein